MKTFASASPVIMDLGMNNGDDTDYYLKKGKVTQAEYTAVQ